MPFRTDYRGNSGTVYSATAGGLGIGPESERDVVYVFTAFAAATQSSTPTATLGGQSGTLLGYAWDFDAGSQMALFSFTGVTGTSADFVLTGGGIGAVSGQYTAAFSAAEVDSVAVVAASEPSDEGTPKILDQNVEVADVVFAFAFGGPGDGLTISNASQIFTAGYAHPIIGPATVVLASHTATTAETPREFRVSVISSGAYWPTGISIRLRGDSTPPSSEAEASDTIVLEDAQTGTLRAVAVGTEAIVLEDSQAGALRAVRAVQETVAFSDAQQAVFRSVVGVQETVLFSEAQAGALRAAGATEESISLTDAQISTLLTVGQATEEITFSDDQQSVAPNLSDLLETVTFSDTQAASLNIVAAVTEGFTLQDAQAVVPRVQSECVEYLSLTDAQNSVLYATDTVTESVLFSDRVEVVEDTPAYRGAWGPDMPRRKREKPDRILEDVLQVLEQQRIPPAQKRSVKQLAHRVVRNTRPTTFQAMQDAIDVDAVEERLIIILSEAIVKAKKKKRREEEELLLLM